MTSPSRQLERRRVLILLLAAVLPIAVIGCPPPADDDVIYPCPGDPLDTTLGVDGLCTCDGDEEVFMANSLTCEACESQDAQGRYCDCGGGAFIDMDIAGDFAECVVPPDCAPGTFWNGSFCTACGFNQCGGTCGGCLIGSQCINSVCTNLWECCFRNTSGATERCYFEEFRPPFPNEACTCIVAYSSTTPPGFYPGYACGVF